MSTHSVTSPFTHTHTHTTHTHTHTHTHHTPTHTHTTHTHTHTHTHHTQTLAPTHHLWQHSPLWTSTWNLTRFKRRLIHYIGKIPYCNADRKICTPCLLHNDRAIWRDHYELIRNQAHYAVSCGGQNSVNERNGTEREGGTESHPQTVSQYFNVALKTAIAVRIGMSSENIWVFSMRSAVLTEQVSFVHRHPDDLYRQIDGSMLH